MTASAADPYAFVAQRLQGVPVWIFHGAEDTAVLPSESRKMAAALRDAQGLVRYTEYEGVGHNSWDRAYADDDLWAWLFRQKRNRRSR